MSAAHYNEVARLLGSGLVEDAVLKLKAYALPADAVWSLAEEQASQRRFDRASRVLETLPNPAAEPKRIAHFILAALKECEFQLGIKWSLTLNGARPTPYDCVNVAIARDYVETALKIITELNLQGYDVDGLLARLCQQENFAAVKKYAQKFNLEEKYTPERLLEMMLQAGQWESALATKLIPGSEFLRRIIQARDWIAALKYSDQFGIPASSPSVESLGSEKQQVVRMMISGMIQDGKLFQAMRLVLSHKFESEFPPKQLITFMMKERQYAHALRFITALNLGTEFTVDLNRIHRERIQELADFRRLMEVRKRDARARMQPIENPVMVATVFLGVRTLFRRPDGKLVPLALLSTTGEVSRSNSATPSFVEAANFSAGDDDEEEEIVVVKRPDSRPNQPQQHLSMPVHTPAYTNGPIMNSMIRPQPQEMMMPPPMHYPPPHVPQPWGGPAPMPQQPFMLRGPQPPVMHPGQIPPHFSGMPGTLPPPPPPVMPVYNMPKPQQHFQQPSVLSQSGAKYDQPTVARTPTPSNGQAGGTAKPKKSIVPSKLF